MLDRHKGHGDHKPGEQQEPETSNADPEVVSENSIPSPKAEDELPVIVVNELSFPELIQKTVRAIKAQNEKSRRLYVSVSDSLVTVHKRHDGNFVLKPVTVGYLRLIAADSAVWLKKTQDEYKVASPPHELLQTLLSDGFQKRWLPLLRGVCNFPTANREGRLKLHNAKYDDDLQLYVAVSKASGIKKHIRRVKGDSKDFTRKHVDRAWKQLDKVFKDFPFADEASRSNARAALLVPMVREVISGPVPLFLLSKPCPGAGGTLWANTTADIATGSIGPAYSDARTDDEWRKRILSVLREGSPIVLFDNLRYRLDSSTLCSVITTGVFADRILGHSRTEAVEARSLFLATGNNPEVSAEMARRIVLIRLKPETEDPHERADKLPNLQRLVAKNRAKLSAALCIIVAYWRQQGMPKWSGQSLGSFESFCEVIGGILECSGKADGFLENRRELAESSDDRRLTEVAFVEAWWRAFAERRVGAKELVPVVQSNQLALDLGPNPSQSLGYLLRTLKDRIVQGLKIVRMAAGGGVAKYRLEPTPERDRYEQDEPVPFDEEEDDPPLG